jgi:ankyrin repeat protein
MTQPTQDLRQKALFQAAKAGNIELMKEFVEAGADPFEPDERGNNAIFYANLEDSANTAALLLELQVKETGT